MKRFPKWAGYMLLSLFILLLLLFLNWKPASYFVLRKVMVFYAGREQIALDIGRISGNPFSETILASISIHPVISSPQSFDFKAETVSCKYNLMDLKDGYERFLQGLTCSASNPEFTLDYRSAAAQELSAEKAGQFSYPAVLPSLDLHNGSVILAHSGWDAELKGINSSLRTAADGAHELQLQVGNFQLTQDGITRIDTGFTSVLFYKDERLIIDSFAVRAEDIFATGFIDLSGIATDYIPFGADLLLADNFLNISGLLDGKFLKLHAGTDNFDIGELQKRLGGSGWDISGKIGAELDLAYGFEKDEALEGNFALKMQDGQVHGVDIENVSVSGRIDNGVINVFNAEAGTPGSHFLFGDVTVPMSVLQEGNILSILGQSQARFDVDLSDVAILFPLFKLKEDMLPVVVRPNSLALHGHLEKGIIYLDEGKAVTGTSNLLVRQATFPVPSTIDALGSVPVEVAARLESSNLQEFAGLFGNLPASGEFAADIDIKGRLDEPEITVILAGEYLRYREIQLGSLSLQGEIRVPQQPLGDIKSVQFTATELSQANDSGTLALLSPVTGTWKPESYSMSGTFQADGKGEIVLGVRKSAGKDAEGEISIRGLDSKGWLGNFTDTRYFFHNADLEAVISGFPENQQVRLSGEIEEVGGAGMPFPLTGSFALQYSPKGIEISTFSWKSHGGNMLIITGFLPYDPLAPEPFLEGELLLNGHLDIPALGDIGIILAPWEPGTGSVLADIDVNGSWDQAKGRIQVQAEDMEPPEIFRQYLDSPINLACDITAQGDTIVLQSARIESTDYAVQAKGTWNHDQPFLEFLQNLKDGLSGEVGIDATVELRNLNFLRKELPWLRRFEGDIQGELHLSGPANDPALTGSFSVKDGEISHVFNFPNISAVALQGEFNASSISLHSMQAEVGGSPINISGNIQREGETIEVNLAAEGKNVLLYRSTDMQMRGDVRLDVSGPLERLAIKGTTGLTYGYYTRNIDFLGKIGSAAKPVSEGLGFLFSFSDPPLKDAVFNIKITSIEPFRIRNNLIRGTLRPELTLKGTGELPFLLGTIYIDPSRMLLPSGRLQIQSGLVRFPEGAPDRPQLDLLAQSKVLGYDINVVTRGPLDDPVITLSSSPALPNDDLLLLLLTGQPPKEEEGTSGTLGMGRGATNVMVYLGRDFLNRWLEDESGTSDESILDRFELDIGRGVTKTGEQTVEGSFRISDMESGKRKIYYLTAEKDKYDAYNYGLRLVFRFE